MPISDALEAALQAADLRDYVAAVDPFAESAEAARGSGPRDSPHLYDRVLLDAPCSGTGVLAKRADLRWRRQPADLLQLSSLQVTPGAAHCRACTCPLISHAMPACVWL